MSTQYSAEYSGGTAQHSAGYSAGNAQYSASLAQHEAPEYEAELEAGA